MSDDSSHARFLEDQVTCAICYEHFRDPRLLPCAHTYCKQCLDDLVRTSSAKGQITCPECREVFKIGPNGTEELRVNFKTNQIMSHLSVSKSEKAAEESDLPCENCASRDPSKGRCQNCCKFMCDFCLVAHRRILDTRGHKIVTLEEFLGKFSRHISKHDPKALDVIDKGEKKKIQIETKSNEEFDVGHEKIALLRINEQSSQNQKNTKLAEEMLMNDDQNFKVKSCNSCNKFTRDSNNVFSTCSASSCLQTSVNSTDLDGSRHKDNIQSQNNTPDLQDQVHEEPVLQSQDDLHDHRDSHDPHSYQEQSLYFGRPEVVLDDDESSNGSPEVVLDDDDSSDGRPEVVLDDDVPSNGSHEVVLDDDDSSDGRPEVVLDDDVPSNGSHEVVLDDDDSSDGRPEVVLDDDDSSDGRPEVVLDDDDSSDGRPEVVLDDDDSSDGRPEVVLDDDESSDGRPEVVLDDDESSDGRPEVVLDDDESPDGRPEVVLDDDESSDGRPEVVLDDDESSDGSHEVVYDDDESSDGSPEVVLDDDVPSNGSHEVVYDDDESSDSHPEVVSDDDDSSDGHHEVVSDDDSSDGHHEVVSDEDDSACDDSSDE